VTGDGGALRSEVLASLRQITTTEWNELARADGLYSSHEWLTGVEVEGLGRCCYVTVRDHDRLVAALPLYFVDRVGNSVYEPSGHFPGMPAAGGTPVIMGSLSGYRNAPLIARDLPAQLRGRSLRALFHVARETIIANGGTTAALLFLTSGGLHRLEAAVTEVPRPVLTWAGDAWLDVVGDSFLDYRNALSFNRRKTVRNELNRFARAGLALTLEEPWKYIDTIVALADQLNRKHRRVYSMQQHESSLNRQLETLGDHARVFVCRAGRTVIAVALAYEWDGWLYLRGGGFDYPSLRGACEYFNLTIYGPLRYCYERGLKGIHLGAGSHRAKAGRGARIGPLMSVLLSFDPDVSGDPLPMADRTETGRFWRGEMRLLPASYDPVQWKPVIAWSCGEPAEELVS
jgi:hypothetical protein